MNGILWEFSFWSTSVTFSPLLVPRTTQWGREGFPFCIWRMEVQRECDLPELHSCQWLSRSQKKKPIPYHSCLFISRRRLCGIHGFPGQRPTLNWERGRGRRRSKEHGQMSIRRHPVTWWCDHTRTVSQWRVSVHFRLLPFNLPVCVGGGNDCEIQDVMECVLLALNLRSGDSSPSHSKVVPFTPLPGPAPSGEAVGWIQVLHFLT